VQVFLDEIRITGIEIQVGDYPLDAIRPGAQGVGS
jgi:hypothetical protein